MRWFLIPAIATAALTLADSAPAKAQIVIGGNPTYNPRFSIPFVQYPRVLPPASSTPIPYFNGSPVELATDSMLRSAGLSGYGPYAGNYARYIDPRSYVPSNWKAIDPRSSIPTSPKGWFNGRGLGIGKGKGR